MRGSGGSQQNTMDSYRTSSWICESWFESMPGSHTFLFH
jgi:hypothetical protein